MIVTYQTFTKFADGEYLKKTNEELAKIYKNAKNEYEKSQSISCLYIKNFGLLLRISNKCKFLESSEKASMILEEMVLTLKSYDGSTKFVTYLTARISNLFLWEYGKRKKEILATSSQISLEDENEDGIPFQIVDEDQKTKVNSIEFFISVDNIINIEISRYSGEDKESKNMRERLELARKVFNLLKQDDTLVASQLSALLGMFRTDKQGNYILTRDYTIPEYNSGNLYIAQNDNRATQWYTINKAKYLLRDLLIKYGLYKKV